MFLEDINKILARVKAETVYGALFEIRHAVFVSKQVNEEVHGIPLYLASVVHDWVVYYRFFAFVGTTASFDDLKQ